MNLVFLNVVLALLWAALQGSYTLADLIVGLLFGAAVIALGQRALGGRPGYLRAITTLLGFLWFALKEIVVANIALAAMLLSPRMQFKQAILTVPLDSPEPGPVTTLANLITLTPGTLSLDISPDGREMYVHTIIPGDEAAAIAGLKDYERRVLAVFAALRNQ